MISPSAALIFPHQLFRSHPALAPGRPVYLIEETLFFRQLPFHKKKLQLHRASMKAYARYLAADHAVFYIEAVSPESDLRILMQRVARDGIQECHLADPTDDWLCRRLHSSAKANHLTLTIHRSPNFLNSLGEVSDFFDARKNPAGEKHKTYFFADFYMAERKKRSWLVDGSGKPVGGKWSFDSENRKRLPAAQPVPFIRFPKNNIFVTEAEKYVEDHFPGHFGNLSPLPGGGFYPVDFKEADAWLDEFLSTRLAGFGPFEDAMRAADHFLFHSVLTPMLNTGLLDPETVIRKMLTTAREKNVPLPSVEGFLRQIMGWREFVRIVYEREGAKQRTKNFWQFTRKIPPSFRSGQTGIVPIDTVMRKVFATGYAHHIERLMVLGNFMLLCEFDPDEVYRFFMEVFIDAYDWVMVPNIYGMTQFADGGLMTTKPYLSGSSYLHKLGDWKKGPWEETWNGLFWRFLSCRREFFIRHPRWKMLIAQWDRMNETVKKRHLENADIFLSSLDNPGNPVPTSEVPAPAGLF